MWTVSQIWSEFLAVGDGIIADGVCLGLMILVDYVWGLGIRPVIAAVGFQDPVGLLPNTLMLIKLLVWKRFSTHSALT